MTNPEVEIVSNRLRGSGRRVIIIVATLIMILFAIGQISRQLRGARGPRSSSFATTPGGLAALATLLTKQGIAVERLTVSLGEAINTGLVNPNDSLVIVDTPLSPDDVSAIEFRSEQQQRVIVIGSTSFDLDAPSPGNARGLVIVDDAEPFTNAQLAVGANAVNAVTLLTPASGGRVVFAEAGHGFATGSGAGLRAIPAPVRTLLIGLVLGAVLWMFAVGKRIGEADRPDRLLPPGRFEHVTAVASLIQRSTGPRTTGPRSTDQQSTDPQSAQSVPPTSKDVL
jgi:hypothetical protein